jgi:hypothetical protein
MDQNNSTNDNSGMVLLYSSNSSVIDKAGSPVILASNIPKNIYTKYPSDATIIKLSSPFEVKQTWLHSEWLQPCIHSKSIQKDFPNRMELDPRNPNPNIQLIESTFTRVRGIWSLWQVEREEGRWRKLVVPALNMDWVIANVEVLYPSKDRFQVTEINGIILWNHQSGGNKKYHLYEGNHRVSAWLASKRPQSISAVIFVGKPKK